MKEYEILKDFQGSQDGMTLEKFKAGEVALLSDYLVSCVDKSWIRSLSETVESTDQEISPEPEKASSESEGLQENIDELVIENKAIITKGKKDKK